MRALITNRDYEQLSAYIDGQLSPVERRKLEEKLRARTDLQAALDEMSRTRSLLRSAPRRRAPRNFTLTPAMVGERGPRQRGFNWNLFPVLSFTSALATLALVALIVLQLLPGRALSKTAATAPQADRVSMIVQQTMTALEATNPAALQAQPASGAPTSGAALSKEAPAENPSATAAPAAPELAQPPTAMEAPAPTATPQLLSNEQRNAEPAGPQPTETQEAPQAMMLQAATPEAQPTTAPEQPVPPEQATVPVLTWGDQNPAGGGYGSGGGGGGAGPGPGIGELMGPPAPSSGPAVGLGGGFGGGPEAQGAQSGNSIVVPPQDMGALDTAAQPTMTPAQPDPNIKGTGPILGVPAQKEGGQILEKKAILGEPQANVQSSGQREQSQPAESRGASEKTAPSPAYLLPFQVILEVLLALVAIVTAIAAILVRRRAR